MNQPENEIMEKDDLFENGESKVIINPSKRRIFEVGPDDLVIVVANEKIGR